MLKTSTRAILCKFSLTQLLIWAVIFLGSQFFAIAQVRIPRAGFPYCQPFTGITSNPNSLPFTIAKGNTVLGYNPLILSGTRDLTLTGNALELTPDSQDERGYVLIDLPFSSEYGIKASFEYFIYKESIGYYGDGLSFFLIDGDITSSTFQIGGVGGGLGYAPHGVNSGNYTTGGVTGGYMGIGFDVLGNFGNYQEKKYGGFHNPNQFNYSTPTGITNPQNEVRFYPDAISIRGPLQAGDIIRRNGSPPTNTTTPPFNSYQFKGGKIVYFDPTYAAYPASFLARYQLGSGDLYPNPTLFLGASEQFKIASGLKPEDVNCGVALPSGYRKVFIDMKPTGIPAEPYDVTVEMLVGNDPTPVKVLNNVRFQGVAPTTLKVGFAASTGGSYYSKHQIRNVAVQVSSIEDQAKPVPPSLFREICVEDDQEVELPFCVELPSSSNAFIQCIQLYQDDPGAGDNDFATDTYECGLSGYCTQRCNETFKRLDALDAFGNKVGEFIAELDDEVEVGKFNQAEIRYVRTDMAFFGTVTAWYKIVDNFGLESDGTPISITINPLPKIQSKGAPFDVTCDGQGDGAIEGIVISDLAEPGKYLVEFFDDANNPVPFTLVSETQQSNGFWTATFDLTGLNLGVYRVRATNPSASDLGNKCSGNFDDVTADPCVDEFILHTLAQQIGTPVELQPYKDEICEGEIFEVTPELDPRYNPNNLPVPFQWYADQDGNIPLNNGAATIGGNPVTIAVASNGELSVTGLRANGSSPRTYTFYVETLFKDNGPSGAGNFCPFLGDVTTEATVTVFPELQTSFDVTPDHCRAAAGAILVNAQGGAGSKTFNLFLVGNANPLATQVTNANSHTFTNLFPGEYEVEVFTENPTCTKLIGPITVEGPAAPLTLTAGPTTNAYCNIPNGTLEFSLSGGNANYNITVGGQNINSLTFTQNGDNYLVSELSSATYVVEVRDAEDCSISVSMDVGLEAPSEFDASDDEVCEGQEATVSPIVINQSSSTPSFAWFASDGSGGYLPISNGASIAGATFAINPSNFELTVSGLAASATPYTYYLLVSGPKVCDQGYLPAEILVNFGPEMDPPVLSPVNCFGAADGTIQAVIPSGNLADFQFSLNGDNGFSAPFTANNGLFENLAPGTYTLGIQNADGCTSTLDNLVITEPTALLATEVSKVDATCEEENGELRFTVSGGTPNASGGYTVKINGADLASFGADLVTNAPNDFTVTNLAPDDYLIEVTDQNTCPVAITVTIADTPVPEFDVDDVTVCEGNPAVLTPIVLSNTIGALPVYAWYFEDPANAGQYVEIKNGDNIGGVTYQVSNGVLTITGLTFDPDAFTYFMGVSGDKVCPDDLIPVEVRILKIPEAVFEEVPVSCFGGTDGQIKLVSVDPAGPSTFTLIETGASNATGNFTGLDAGAYTVKVQENGSPCFEEFQVTVTEPLALQLINPEKTDPTCGEINGSVKFEIAGGVEAYTVLLNNKPLTDYTASSTNGVYEIKNLPPGAYSINVTDANNCILNLPNQFTLTNDDGFVVDLNPMENQVCLGQNVQLTPAFAVAVPVTPVLKWYKDADLTLPINSNPSPDPDGVIYQINPANGNLTIQNLPVGSYNYYLEVSGPGICTMVETADAEIFAPISAEIVVENITCFGDSDGSIAITPAGGGSAAYEVSINGGPFGSNLNFTDLPAGDYKIDIRNSIGCSFSETVTIEGPTASIAINSPTIERSSCDLDNGSIKDLVITGGWGTYTVEWRKGSTTGPIVPGDATKAENLAPDTYFLIVNDLEGCSEVFEFEIEESSDPVYAVVPPINSCTGNPVSIRPIHIAPNPSLPPAAATEVEWYTGPGRAGLIQNGPDPSNPAISYTIDNSDWLNPELVINGLPAGSSDYYFYVVCTGQEIKIDVTAYDTPNVALDTQPITCFGDTNGKIILTSGTLPAYTYSLNGGAPVNQAGLEAMNLAAGTYYLEVATPSGCAQQTVFTIAGPSGPLASTPLTKIDPGCGAPNGKLELTVTGGWLPYTLDVIKDGVSLGTQIVNESDLVLNGYRPGVYQIEITDKEGCTVTTNSVTLVDGPTQVLVDEDAICVGDLATLIPELDPPAPGATFQWFFDAAKTQPITSSPSPAADGRIYQINSATGELSIGNLPATPSSFNYYVTASGAGVCSGFTGTGKVTVYSNPAATATVTEEVCFGDGGTITINATGGSGTYSYSLNGAPFVNSNVFQVPTGTYQVEVSTPEGCGVLVSDILVTGPASALVSDNIQQNNPSCGLTNGEVRFQLSGGYEPYTVSYSKNGVNAGSIAVPVAGQVIIPNLGEGTYAVQVTDTKGCIISLPNSLSLEEVPTVISAQDEVICEGETAVLLPSVPTNIPNPVFTWYFDAQATSAVPANGTLNGVTYATAPTGVLSISGLNAANSTYTYYVSASGTGICGVVPKPVKVTVYGIPNLKVSNPSVVCDPNGTVDLTNYIEGFNPSVYDYNVQSPSGNFMQLDELDDVSVTGDYRVSSSAKGSNCWNNPQRIRVLIAEVELIADFQFEVDLGGGNIITNGDIQIQEDVVFEDLSQGNVLIWQWDFGDGNTSGEQNPVHQFQNKGSYTVVLTTIDDIGCVSTFEMVVQVFDDYNVMIPNAFTPDGTKNQRFKPHFRGIASMEFYIFNTWGELIYKASSLEDQGWDGTLNNTPAPNGNYVYKGKFVSRSGESFEKSGVFVLIR